MEELKSNNMQFEDHTEGKDTYRIYDYLKNKPGLLAGIGSILSVVVTAMIHLCSYASECARLNYWNVDVSFINFNLPVRLSGTVATFVFVCVFGGCMWYIEFILSRFKPILEAKYYIRSVNRVMRKESLKNKWEVLLKSNKRKKRDKTHRENIKECKSQIVIQKKKINENCKEAGKIILKHIFLMELYFAMAVFIWLSMGDVVLSQNIVVNGIVSILMSVGFLLPLALFLKSTYIDKTLLKQCAKQAFANKKIVYDIDALQVPSIANWFGELRFRFSDTKLLRFIKRAAVIIIYWIFAITLVFYFFGFCSAVQKEQFQVVNDDSKTYTVIYNNGENAVLAEFGISNDEYTVDTAKQMIMPIEGLRYTIIDCGRVKIGPVDQMFGEVG